MSQDKRDKKNADRSSASADKDAKKKQGAGKPAGGPKAGGGGTGQAAGAGGAKRDAGAPNKADDSAQSKGASSSGPAAAARPTSSSGDTAKPTVAASGGAKTPKDGEPGTTSSAKTTSTSTTDNSAAGKASGSADAARKAAAGSAGVSGKQASDKRSAPTHAATPAAGKSGSNKPADTAPKPAAASGADKNSAGKPATASSGTATAASDKHKAAPSSVSSAARSGSTAGGGHVGRGGRSGSGAGGGRSLGLVVAVMALIVALVAAACTGYLWYRGQQRVNELDSRIGTVEKGLQSNVQKVVMPKLSDMRDRIGQFSQRVDRLSQALDQRKQQIAQLQQTIQHVQTQNNQLSDQLGGNHEQFVEQRIALLLEAANQRLQVERDPKGAAQALSLADQAIVKSGDPALHPVRAKIADEMASLKALPDPDIEGLSLKLSNAIQQVPELAVKSNVPSSYHSSTSQGGSEQSDSASDGDDDHAGAFAGVTLARKWHQFVGSVGDALSRMVTIRRANGTENAPALMAPDQAYFLTQNLQLQLRTARLALLNGDAQTYRDSLTEAHDWIQKYFDTSDSKVSAILKDLNELSHVQLQWQAPDLSPSLQALHQIMDRNDNGGDSQSDADAGNGQGAADPHESDGDAQQQSPANADGKSQGTHDQDDQSDASDTQDNASAGDS